MDRLFGYYTEVNKSDIKREITYDFTYMWNLKQNNKTKSELIDTENRSVVTREKGVWGEGEMGEGDQPYGD